MSKTSNFCVHQNIIWHPRAYHKKPLVLGTLKDIYNLNELAFKIVKEHSIKIIHCRSYITSLIGLRLKKKLGTKFIFDMRGFWADERIEGGIWNNRNPIFQLIYKYFKKKESQFIQEADHIISLTENAKEEMVTNKNLSSNRKNIKNAISVIPTCVDIDHFDPKKISTSDQSQLKKKLGIRKEEYILLYLGSIGTWYMLEEMLKFFIQLKKQKVKSRFLLVTPDDRLHISSLYRDICYTQKECFCQDDIIIVKTDRKNVPLHISISDSSIFFIKPTYSKKASSATKMGELIAMGKPVISNVDWGDIEKNIILQVGVLNLEFNNSSYLQSTKTLISKKWDSKFIRTYAEENFSLTKGIISYENIYKNLVN